MTAAVVLTSAAGSPGCGCFLKRTPRRQQLTATTSSVLAKLPKGTRVAAVAGGGYHSLALTSTGSVLAWGYNTNGQLGDEKTKSSDLPVKVKLP